MLLPIAIFLLLFSIKKELFTESTKRIVHYSEVYEKPAPYSFVITNDSLKAFQYEDYTVNVKVEGSEVPDEVYIKYKNRNYKCQKNANYEFSYTFSNLQQNTEFQINTDEVTSTVYEIEVLPKPVMLGFSMSMHYPSYLNKPDEVLENVSNVTVPEGTKITWNFITRNSENLILIVDENKKEISSEKDNYLVTVTANNSFTYSILNKNKFMTGKDTIPDKQADDISDECDLFLYVWNDIGKLIKCLPSGSFVLTSETADKYVKRNIFIISGVVFPLVFLAGASFASEDAFQCFRSSSSGEMVLLFIRELFHHNSFQDSTACPGYL